MDALECAVPVIAAVRDLEVEFERELYQSRIVHGRVYRAEADCAYVVDRQAKLCVIEEVEELCAEVQAHLSWQGKLLDDGEIRIDEVGT